MVNSDSYKNEFPQLKKQTSVKTNPNLTEETDDMQTLLKEVSELNKLVNIKELIQKIRKIKNAIKNGNGDIMSILAALSDEP